MWGGLEHGNNLGTRKNTELHGRRDVLFRVVPCASVFQGFPNYAGLKYNTIAAPADAIAYPTHSSGFGATFGGLAIIDTSTLTSGAPPKTSGITTAGDPPFLKAKIMQAAPMAPSAPPIVDQTMPPCGKFLNCPAEESVITGISTPIRK